MEISSQASRVDPAHVPLEQLAGSQVVSQKDKVAELSRQFEAVLVRQILNDAQKPLIKSKYNQESSTSSIHRDLTVNEMAEQITRSGGLGFARQLQQDLARQTKTEPADSSPPQPATSTPAAPASTRFPRWKHSNA